MAATDAEASAITPHTDKHIGAPAAKEDVDETEKGGRPSTTIEIEDGEPQKTYYSKTSVWLMVLFSGLAIGSDG